MNANELRIGNYLLGYDNNYFTWDYGHYDLCSKGIDADELGMPIELTEEILLKCGFKEIRKGVFKLKDWYIDLTSKVWKFKREYQDINFKHLHQLQNLYFALTGKELEIEL
ncbi:hypothetical protein OBJ95_06055 [Empedobacter falsenii]